jgi:hypothetical protein
LRSDLQFSNARLQWQLVNWLEGARGSHRDVESSRTAAGQAKSYAPPSFLPLLLCHYFNSLKYRRFFGKKIAKMWPVTGHTLAKIKPPFLPLDEENRADRLTGG